MEFGRVEIGVVGVVGVCGGAGDFKLQELGGLRNDPGEVLFLFNGRLRVLFDTLLFNCGADDFLATAVGVFRSFVEGLFDIGVVDDAN